MKLMATLLPMLLLCSTTCLCQDGSTLDKAIAFPDRLFNALDKKTDLVEKRLDRQTEKYLTRLQRQESKLRRKLYKKDSLLARQLFDGLESKYRSLASLTGGNTSLYSGHLDSLSTALKFLSSNKLSALSANPSLQKTLAQYKSLQGKLNASDQIRVYLKRREQLLKDQLEKLGMVKQLKQFRRQVYYYQAQVKEYKEAFEDPTRLEEKLLSLAQSLPAFKDFFARNSILGSMFSLPGSSGYPTAALAGLQTRAMVNQVIVNQFGNTPAVTQQLQQNVRSAQSQLSALRQRVGELSSGSVGNTTSDPSMPNFKPNSQKTHSFLKRIEIGTNMQSQRASYYFPVTSDFGLSLGYKLNDKSTVGVGASYKVGWGTGWNNLRLSSQGAGLRSFLDYQVRGSFYISGGYEQNYRSAFYRLDQLRTYAAWQSSGLIGVTKKYNVSKKIKGSMQLLWDFLSYRQVPSSQAVLFRIGYTIK